MREFFSIWIRILREAFTDKYFLTWFIPLVTLAFVIAIAVYLMLGFDHVFKTTHEYSAGCRNLSDKEALSLLMMVFVSLLSCLVAVGELIIFADDRRQHLPVNVLRCILTSCLAVLSLGGTLLLTELLCH